MLWDNCCNNLVGDKEMSNSNGVSEAGIGFGCALAIVISWSLYKSIFWAILHGIFGWFYVIYYACTR